MVSPEIVPVDAIASSHSIYATTPSRFVNFKIMNFEAICNNAELIGQQG
ncbi:MAG: hypothetical protein VB140_04970 [Burkholderia sp.]